MPHVIKNVHVQPIHLHRFVLPMDEQHFFSPCFAGCREIFMANQTLTDCSCIKDVNNDNPAHIGYCQRDIDKCTNLVPYLMVVLGGSIVSATARTANALISFRSVDPMDKGFTIGAASAFMAIFGIYI